MSHFLGGKWQGFKSCLEMYRWFDNWRDVWAAYRAGGPLPPLKIHRGPTLFHGPNDDPIHLFREIFVERCYAPAWFYRPKATDRIVDIGANIGVTALYFSWAAPGIRIHAFEPAAPTRENLTANIERNHLKERVAIHPYAVSDRAGLLKLFGASSSGHRSFVMSRFSDERSVEEVSCLPLADALARCEDGQIDLLKIDVEGSEIEILPLSGHAALGRVQRVVVEYHDLFRSGCKDHATKALRASGFDIMDTRMLMSDGQLGLLFARRNA